MLKKQSNNIKLIALFIAIILIIIALVFGVSKFIFKDQDENTPIQFNEYKVQEQEIVLSSEEYTGDSVIVTVTPSILPVVNSGKTGIDVMKLQYQITEPDAILSNNDNDWIDYIEPVEVDHNSTFNTRLVTRGHTDTSLEMDYTSPVTSREINNIAVAQLGNKTYKTLAEAITAWGDLTTEEKQTSTIQMLANTSENITIPQTEEIKIDLCGFDIIEESSETPTIIVNGVLNIVDSGKTENNSTTYGKVTSTSNTAIKVTGANSELVLGTNESANGEDDEEVNKEGPVINGGTGSNGVLVEQGGNLEFYDGKITAPKTAQAGANTAIVVNNTPVGNENGNLITVPTGYRLDLSDDETAGREIATVVKKMMVSFDSNGGEPSNIADIEVGEGKAYGKYAEWPSDPTREGYTFGGWKTVENLISTNPSDWEQGGIHVDTGLNTDSNNVVNPQRIRLKDYLEVIPSHKYIMDVNNSEDIVIRNVFFYTENYQYIGKASNTINLENLEFDTPANCKYINVVLEYMNETTLIAPSKVADADLSLMVIVDSVTPVTQATDHTLKAVWTPNTYNLVKVSDEENIISNGTFENYSIVNAPKWDKALNGIPGDTEHAYSAEGWSTYGGAAGWNAGVEVPEIGYHAHMRVIDGNAVIRFKTNEDYAGQTQENVDGGVSLRNGTVTANRWMGLWHVIDGNQITAGKTYTFTLDACRISGSNKVSGGLYYANTESGSSKDFRNGQFYFNPTTVGTWETFSWTFTVKDNYSCQNVDPSVFIYGYYGGTGEVLVDNIRLQEVTPIEKTYDSTYTAAELTQSTKEGYTSDGWYSRPESVTALSSSDNFNTSTALFENVGTDGTNAYIYEKMHANNYTVTYDYDGATSENSDVTKTVTYGENYGTLPEPAKTGYTFDGWNGKNKINIDKAVNDHLVDNGDGTYTMWYKNTGRFSKHIFMNIPKNTTLIMSYDLLEYNGSYKDPLQIFGLNVDETEFYIKTAARTTQKDIYRLTIYQDGSQPVGTYTKFKNLQLEEGSTATPYEPYFVTSSTPVTQAQNHTLKAIWTPNQYTVSFNANDGTGSMSNQTMTYGTAANLTANSFTRTGYIFDGWNTESDGSGESYTDGQSVTNLTASNNATINLYAQWTPIVASTTIGGTTTYYGTVQDAIDAVPADGTSQSEGTLGTVTLLYDGTRTEAVEVAEGQNIILDTNRKTLTSATGTVSNNGKLKITGGGTLESTAAMSTNEYVVSNSGNLEFENTTIYAAGISGINNKGTGHLEVNSGNINTGRLGINSASTLNTESNPAVVINDVTISSASNSICFGNGLFIIKDGTYTKRNSNNTPAIIGSSGKIIIENATVTADSTRAIMVQGSTATAEVRGGTFSGLVAVQGMSGNVILKGGTFIGTQYGIHVSGANVVLGSNDDSQVSITSPIVSSNGTGIKRDYGTFKFYDGIIKAPTGQTINGTVAETPEGYYVTNGTEGTLETAYLDNHYTVTYDYSDATSGNTVINKTVGYGENYGTLPQPEKTGYTFEGWNGKNLFNMEAWLNTCGSAYGGTITKGNNSITITDTTDNNNGSYTITYYVSRVPYGNINSSKTLVKPNTNYTLSWKTDSNKAGMVYVFINNKDATDGPEYQRSASRSLGKFTFTTPEDAEFVTIRFDVNNYGDSLTYSDVQLEEGSTATEYEPYYVTSSTPVTQAQNHTLKAIWTPNQYTVSFNANDGTGSMSNQTMTYGTAANLTANSFTRTGYEFAGWNTAADGSGTSYTDAQSVSNLTDTNGATVTLYANWTANTYTVTFDANGGTMNSTTPTTAYTQNYGTTITMNNPTRDGYQFMGWVSDQRQNVTTAGYWTYANSIDPLTGERLEIINDDDHRLNGYAGGTAYVADPTSPSGWYITSAGTGATVTTSTVNYTEEDPNPLCINATSFYRITRESYTDARFSYGPIKNMPFIERDVNKIYVIVARFPEGWRLTHVANAGLGKQKWLTSNAGTGDWETYVVAVESSDNAAYQNSGYFFISNTNSNTNTVNPTLDVAYLQGYFTNKQSETANVNQFKVGAINETLTAKWQAVNQSVVINESDSNASYKVNASNLFDKTDMIITNSKIVSKSPTFGGASINQADDTHFISGLIRVIPGATYKITGATEDGLVEWFTTGKNASLYSRETQATTYTNDTNFTPPTTYTLYSNSSTQPVTYTYMRFHAKTSDINNIQLQMVDSPTYTGNKTFVFPNNASVDVISTPLAGYTTAITKTSGLGTFTTSTSGDIVTGSLANVAGAASTTNLAITNTPTVNPNNGTLNRTRGAVNSLMSTNMNNFEAEAIDTNNGTTESETVESNISSYNYEVIPQQENGTEHEVAATLADAIATASSGEIIKVINSVTEDETATNSAGKTITIDLNGKTITSTATNTINNQGILTIKGTGIIKNEIENGIVIYNTGSLNMEDGVVTTAENGGKAISNNGDGSNYQGSDTNNVEKSGTVNIKSGKIVTEGIGAIGLYNANNAKANISGGIFEIRNYASKAIYNDSELEIENAKVVVSDYDSIGIYNGKNSKSCIIKENEIFIEAEEIENYELIKNTDQFKEYIDKLKPSYGIYNDSDSEVIIETATIKAERLKSVGIMNNAKGTVTLGVDESKDGKEIELNNASPIVYAISDNTTAIINNKDGIINFYDGRVLTTSTIKNMIVNVLNNYEIYEELNSNVINTTLRLIVEEVESGSVDSNSEEISENESSEENENVDNESEDI